MKNIIPNNSVKRCLGILCLIATTVIQSCKTERLDGGNFVEPTDKSVVGFSLKKPDNTTFRSTDITTVIGSDTIKVYVPGQTDLSKLIPDIAIRARAISPASETAQNFTKPVHYVLRAEDGSTRTYTVVVKLSPLKNIVFAGSNNKVFYAIDAIDGQKIWSYSDQKNFCYSSPIYYNNTVYAAADNTLYAFDAPTGKVNWTFDTGNKIKAAPAYDNGIVYFGSYDHHFRGLDALTGIVKLDIIEPDDLNTTASIVNGIAYISSSTGSVYAINLSKGTSTKIFKTGGAVAGSSPTVANNVLYIGSDDNNMYAISPSSGQVKWKLGTDGISAGFTHPFVTGGVVYFGTAQSMDTTSTALGSMYAADANTGAIIWKALEHKGFYSSPIVSGNSVYATCFDSYMYALNAKNGSVLWKSLIYPNSNTTSTLAEGYVFVGGGTGNLYALNAGNGTTKWTFPMPGNTFTSAPCIIGSTGIVYGRQTN
jgi:outer membrane protein assembly factor BamB